MAKSQHTAEHTVLMNVLVRAREKCGFTQTQLAKALGKHQSFIAKIEVGERRLDVLEFCAISRALGIEPVALMETLLAGLPEHFDI
ncbi:helix-turn-helix domain-containing protein [Rhizorhabdus argentea]|uniref:helix-turn-helix domain-containing protein n=1 Tax=Rhizorhabdus argentea TaxID=1387174 RepID=UPI0030EBDC01